MEQLDVLIETISQPSTSSSLPSDHVKKLKLDLLLFNRHQSEEEEED